MAHVPPPPPAAANEKVAHGRGLQRERVSSALRAVLEITRTIVPQCRELQRYKSTNMPILAWDVPRHAAQPLSRTAVKGGDRNDRSSGRWLQSRRSFRATYGGRRRMTRPPSEPLTTGRIERSCGQPDVVYGTG